MGAPALLLTPLLPALQPASHPFCLPYTTCQVTATKGHNRREQQPPATCSAHMELLHAFSYVPVSLRCNAFPPCTASIAAGLYGHRLYVRLQTDWL